MLCLNIGTDIDRIGRCSTTGSLKNGITRAGQGPGIPTAPKERVRPVIELRVVQVRRGLLEEVGRYSTATHDKSDGVTK
jgi:hypothetical protein